MLDGVGLNIPPCIYYIYVSVYEQIVFPIAMFVHSHWRVISPGMNFTGPGWRRQTSPKRFPLGVKWARATNSGMWRLRCWKGVKGVQARRWIGTDCTYVYDSMII